MKLKLGAIGLSFLLAACTQGGDKYGPIIANSVPPTADLKAQLVAGAKSLIYDPASIKDAEISNVATFTADLQGVCVRADSKNVDGNYMGVRSMGVPIRDGKVFGGLLEHPICNRADVTWHKFPELDHLKTRK